MLFLLRIDLFLKEIALSYTIFYNLYRFLKLWSKVEGHNLTELPKNRRKNLNISSIFNFCCSHLLCVFQVLHVPPVSLPKELGGTDMHDHASWLVKCRQVAESRQGQLVTLSCSQPNSPVHKLHPQLGNRWGAAHYIDTGRELTVLKFSHMRWAHAVGRLYFWTFFCNKNQVNLAKPWVFGKNPWVFLKILWVYSKEWNFFSKIPWIFPISSFKT